MAASVNIHAYFNPTQFKRIMSALNRLERSSEQLEDALPRQQATDYSQLLVNNILSGRHMSGYTPYSAAPSAPRYEDWKTAWATYSGYWQAMGSLVNSITHWKERNGVWLSGIPAGVMDAGGTSWFGHGDRGPAKPIAMYAKTMEFGLNKQPERPIFRPTLKEYKRGGFVRRGERALRILAGKWR